MSYLDMTSKTMQVCTKHTLGGLPLIKPADNIFKQNTRKEIAAYEC